jgi:uncharacterized protein (DUF2164 family)
MAIELSREDAAPLIASIQKYFRDKLEEDIGDLKARLLLDFCLQEICPTVYNRAVHDAQAYFQEKVTDLDGTCFQPERTYWRKSGSASGRLDPPGS